LTPDKRERYVHMVRKNLTREVVATLSAAPGSMRALAEAAGVSPALLASITTGTRAATPAVALKLATALETWSATCTRAARQLRAAARRVPTSRTGRTP
jgi:transcriptional regulator with XRE-family HTH domain